MAFRILIVDDDTTLAVTYKTFLGISRYAVDIADCAQTAVDQAYNTTYDLILMDLQLPGTNGFKLIEKIRRSPNNDNVPFAIISAMTDEHTRQKADAAGSVGFIPKPTTPIELRDWVEATYGQAA